MCRLALLEFFGNLSHQVIRRFSGALAQEKTGSPQLVSWLMVPERGGEIPRSGFVMSCVVKYVVKCDDTARHGIQPGSFV